MVNVKKILLFIIGLLFVTNVYAELKVEYDGFDISEPNHVKTVSGLGIGNINSFKVTGTDKDYIKHEDYNNMRGLNSIYYYGPLEFGDSTTPIKTNEIDAEITLRWNGAVSISGNLIGYRGALLYDGKVADVIMKISDIKIALTENVDNEDNPGNTSTDGNYYSSIAYGNNFVVLSSETPKIGIADKSWDSLSEAEKKALSTSANVGSSYKVTVQIVEHGTDNPIDTTKYKNMAFGAYDIDIADNTVDYSALTDTTDIIKAQYGDLDGYNANYVEGIEFISGFNDTIHLAKNEPVGGNVTQQSVVNYIENGPNGGLKIKGNGNKFSDTSIRKDRADDNTYYAGFMTMADPKGFSFYWTGSDCGTAIFTSQDVTISQTHNEGGQVLTTTYGITAILDREEDMNHAIGSTPNYLYSPYDGYYVKSLKVNGEDVEVASNFVYKFNNLVYNPLVKLDNDGYRIFEDEDGNILSHEEGKANENSRTIPLENDYSFDVTFAPNEFTIVFENETNAPEKVNLDNISATYGVETTLPEVNDTKNYIFNGWKVYFVTEDGNRIVAKDNNENDIILANRATINDIAAPNNGQLVLVAQWQAKEFTVIYDSGSANDNTNTMSEEKITYNGSPIYVKENTFKKENAIFENWKAYLETSTGAREELLDANNEIVYIPDKGEITNLNIPNGGRLVLIAQWKDSETNNTDNTKTDDNNEDKKEDVINPKTGYKSIYWISTGIIVSLGGFYYLKRKDYFSKF